MTNTSKSAPLESPVLQVMPSKYCNLKCPYCAVITERTSGMEEDFLLSEEFLEKVGNLSGVRISLSGGEPFLHVKGLKSLIRIAEKRNHLLSFNSSLAVPAESLREILEDAPIGVVDSVSACHHLWSGVKEDLFVENVEYVRTKGVKVAIKYIAIPEDFDRIPRYLEFWRAKAFETSVWPLMGPWKMRIFPEDYTSEELAFILPKTNNLLSSLQFLGGLESKGMLCRAGNSTVIWNAAGRGEISPCCHLVGDEVDWAETNFATGIRKDLPCRKTFCLSSSMPAVSKICAEFKNNLKPDGQSHPTVSELVTVARKIENETGRCFTGWPKMLEQAANELGLGMMHDIPPGSAKKEVFALKKNEFLPKLEVRAVGGTPVVAVTGGCVTVRTFSGTDSLRTPFFDAFTTGHGRKRILLSFESVNMALGGFSWRIVVQNSRLETLMKKTVRSEPVSGEEVSTIEVPISFIGNDRTLRIIFVPVGMPGSTFVLGEAFRLSLSQQPANA